MKKILALTLLTSVSAFANNDQQFLYQNTIDLSSIQFPAPAKASSIKFNHPKFYYGVAYNRALFGEVPQLSDFSKANEAEKKCMQQQILEFKNIISDPEVKAFLDYTQIKEVELGLHSSWRGVEYGINLQANKNLNIQAGYLRDDDKEHDGSECRIITLEDMKKSISEYSPVIQDIDKLVENISNDVNSPSLQNNASISNSSVHKEIKSNRNSSPKKSTAQQ